MDYVQEELLRQGRALAALLGGGPEEERREKPEGQSREAVPVERGPGVRSRPTQEPEYGGFGGGAPAEQLRRRTASGGVRRTGAGEAAAAGPAEAATAQRRAVLEEMARTGVRQEAAGFSEGRFLRSGVAGAGRPPEIPGLEELSPGTGGGGFLRRRGWTAPQGGAVDVQAVSRAVERDARRYDGGFSIY